MTELALGTVQLGLPYGIHNRAGQPRREEAFAILSEAWKSGVRALDTASAYGESEAILGEHHAAHPEMNFKICTKAPAQGPLAPGPRAALESSLERLRRGRVEWFLLHRAEDLRDARVRREMLECREQGLAEKVGVSVYEPREVEEALDLFPVEAVQLPLNFLDQRALRSGLLERLRASGVEVFTRSVFLQGLFFFEPEGLPAHLSGAAELLRELRRRSHEAGSSISSLIFQWHRRLNLVDYTLVGVESLEQLQANLRDFNGEPSSGAAEDFSRWAGGLGVPDDSILIDPRRWTRPAS